MDKNVTGSGSIKSVDTTFAIIEFLQEQNSAGVTEIAEHVGRSKSTVHGHLTSMVNAGYAVNEGTTYRLGLRFLDHGIHVRDQMDIVQVAQPKVEELAEETDELAWCLVEEHGMGYWICKASGKHPVNTDVRLGLRRHLHYHSAGKAILAFQSNERIRMIVDRYGLPRRTENTITDIDTLFEEVERIREQGYALNEEESVKGLRAVAAPIRHPSGEVESAISISGPKNRMKGDWFREELPDLVLGAANEVEINLEYF